MLGRGLAAAAIAAALDQLSKYWLLQHFHESGCGKTRAEAVTPFFDLVLTCNQGVSFGLFNRTGLNALVFAVGAAVVVLLLIFWLSRMRTSFLAIAIGLIIGGAIGNVVDRLLPSRGGVIDFLSFHLPDAVCNTFWSGCWPAFNLADSAICVGVTAMLIDGLLGRRASSQAREGEISCHERR